MRYRVLIQPGALRSLEAQCEHIAQDNPAAAARWFNRFLTGIEKLSSFPERCPVARESEFAGREIRLWLFGKRRGVRRVYFVIDGDTVRILSIRHASQSEISLEDLLGE
jgi:plasmid stabilization system protein ParE